MGNTGENLLGCEYCGRPGGSGETGTWRCADDSQEREPTGGHEFVRMAHFVDFELPLLQEIRERISR